MQSRLLSPFVYLGPILFGPGPNILGPKYFLTNLFFSVALGDIFVLCFLVNFDPPGVIIFIVNVWCVDVNNIVIQLLNGS